MNQKTTQSLPSVEGLRESSYIFIDGIGGSDFWKDKKTITIAETGFGAGLNFINLWHHWQTTAVADQRLNFISTEAHPLPVEQITQALSLWPELSPLVLKLTETYPVLHPGIHRLIFDQGRVSLTLIFGDAAASYAKIQGHVDAWFLNEPSHKTETMWTVPLFQQIARLSKPQAKLAALSTAAPLKQGLSAVGFDVETRSGYKNKPDCLCGQFSTTTGGVDVDQPWKKIPWFTPVKPLAYQSKIAIIGGGIAGLTLAKSLLSRGFDITVFESGSEVATVGSGNIVGLVQPRLTAADSLDGQFNASAFLHAVRYYSGRAGEPDLWLENRGVLQLARNDEEDIRFQRLIKEERLPCNVMSYLSAKEASDIAGIPLKTSALYFPTGGCVNPKDIVTAHGEDLKQNSTILTSFLIQYIEKKDDRWILKGLANGSETTTGPFDAVVLANGPFADQTWPHWHVPLHAKRGQVSYVKATEESQKLKCSLSFDGYMSPAYEFDSPHKTQNQKIHVAGASYANFDTNPSVEGPNETAGWRKLRDQESEEISNNLDLHLEALKLSPTTEGRAGLRATVPDHLAILGPLPDYIFFKQSYDDLHHGKHISHYPKGTYHKGLYCFTGLGSRGVQTSPLLAEALADLITGEPCALPIDQLIALHPARFHIRHLKRPPALRPTSLNPARSKSSPSKIL